MVIYYLIQPHITIARIIKSLKNRKIEVNRVWWSLQDKKWFNATYREAVFHTTEMMNKGTKESLVREMFGKAS